MAKANFTKWHPATERPEVRRQVVINADHDHHFIIGAILKPNGYTTTNYGEEYWDTLVAKMHFRYWYYIDEIGREVKDG